MDNKELAKIMKRFNSLTPEEKNVAKKYFLFVSYERKDERQKTAKEIFHKLENILDELKFTDEHDPFPKEYIKLKKEFGDE